GRGRQGPDRVRACCPASGAAAARPVPPPGGSPPGASRTAGGTPPAGAAPLARLPNGADSPSHPRRPTVSFRRLLPFWFAALCLLGRDATVTAGTPKLARLVPPGGQRGTAVEVDFTGRHLDQAREVLFYEPGITVDSIKPVESIP